MESPMLTGDIEHITRANQVDSPFLRLPAELRNTIYALAFSEKIVVKIHPKWEDPRCYPEYVGPHGAAALPLACRQLYQETQIIFMSNAIFDVRGRDLQDFVDDLGAEKAALVKFIVVDNYDKYSSTARGGWVTLARTKGKLSSLERVHCVGMRDLGSLRQTKLGSILDWVSGGLVHEKSRKLITVLDY